MKNGLIEMNLRVLAGEPVISGSRISARLVAELIGNGARPEELQDDFDLSLEQIEAQA